MREFFESAKTKLQQSHSAKRDVSNWFVPSSVDKKSSASSGLGDSRKSGSALSIDSAGSSKRGGSDLDLATKSKFDQMLEHVLSELTPVCQAEQSFCLVFFRLDAPLPLSPPLGGSTAGESSEARERRGQEELRKMMTSLFPSLETELTELVQVRISPRTPLETTLVSRLVLSSVSLVSIQ